MVMLMHNTPIRHTFWAMALTPFTEDPTLLLSVLGVYVRSHQRHILERIVAVCHSYQVELQLEAQLQAEAVAVLEQQQQQLAFEQQQQQQQQQEQEEEEFRQRMQGNILDISIDRASGGFISSGGGDLNGSFYDHNGNNIMPGVNGAGADNYSNHNNNYRGSISAGCMNNSFSPDNTDDDDDEDDDDEDDNNGGVYGGGINSRSISPNTDRPNQYQQQQQQYPW